MAGSPYETAATIIKTVIDTEFAPEHISAIHDNLHESLGRHRVAVGIAPVEETARSGNAIVQDTMIEVKFYDLWTNEIDPETVVNPFKITAYAERLRSSLGRTRASTPGTGEVWYFDVLRVAYPNDPTGNKTRFVATIRAVGNNSGVVETIS